MNQTHSSPTRDEIEKARYTRAQLAEWGVPCPPPTGWRKRLLREAGRGADRQPIDLQPAVRVGPYTVGEPHRAWPEWTWDRQAFVRTAR